jgi:hypothetical protein
VETPLTERTDAAEVEKVVPPKAIAGKEHTEWRRIFVRLQGAAVGASSNDVIAAATQKAGEKTSQAVCSLTEIA